MNLIFSLTRPWLLIMVILLHYRVFNDDLLINFWGGGILLIPGSLYVNYAKLLFHYIS